ncbi:MAG: DNA polymerase/3'-5' exonuclease PolX [Proteobacteria bacterium]|nr:DNA polymerase/3'-5' exonuclease PolX [Pseudomonadota bacterium]
MDKKEAAAALRRMAVLLELTGANSFKVSAYDRGARALEAAPGDLDQLIAAGLDNIKGIGSGLKQDIEELRATGRLAEMDQLAAAVPAGLFDLLRLPGLGPKKVKKLYQDLGVTNLGELEYACLENRLVELKGFGPTSQAKVLAGLQELKRYQGRFLLGDVRPWALRLIQELRADLPQAEIHLAGGVRRFCPTLTEVDLVVAGAKALEVGRALEASALIDRIGAGDEADLEGRAVDGWPVRVWLATEDHLPAALVIRTGAAAHVQALSNLARQKRMTLDAGGLTKNGRAVKLTAEEDLYQALGLPLIAPELREDHGEIEAAREGRLPPPVTLDEVKGTWHLHTTASDGAVSLEQYLAAARERGWSYLGIADHSRSAFYAGGLTEEELDEQRAEIERINAAQDEVRFLWGIESDIKPDGALDYPDDILSQFDYVVASVHSNFTQSEGDMTQRLVRAVSHPTTRMLGHLTGRLLLARKGYQFDLEAVLAALAESDVALELNANPHRLDADEATLRRAVALGIKIAVNPDAHHLEGLDDMASGLAMARRGWGPPELVLNTWPPDEVAQWLARES